MGGVDSFQGIRINICRPNPPSETLVGPVKLNLPGIASLPHRIFRVRSDEELRIGAEYRELIQDFSNVLSQVRPLIQNLPSCAGMPFVMPMPSGSYDEAGSLALSARLQDDLRQWREVRIVGAGLQLMSLDQLDATSPISCHRAARSLVLHHAVLCVESIITRPWLTSKPSSDPIQQHLHDECLRGALRACDSIPLVRALLSTRQAPFVPIFIICGLFNAATSFAIPILRAVHTRTHRSHEDSIRNLPAWPEHLYLADSHDPTSRLPNVKGTIDADPNVKQYANNMLVILDMLAVLNALPAGRLAQDRLETLIQQFGLRDEQPIMRCRSPFPVQRSATGAADTLGLSAPLEPVVGIDDPNGSGSILSEMPGVMDPFSGLWDELLQLDPGIWKDLLEGGGGSTAE